MTGEVVEVDGRLTLTSRTGRSAAGAGRRWRQGQAIAVGKSTVPAQHQIRGLGPIVLNVHDWRATDAVLTEVMNMRRVRDYAAPDADADPVFAMGEGGPAAELHVIERRIAARAAGRGRRASCRVPHAGRDAIPCLGQRLNECGVRNSGEVDRFYFRSLYFREPNGILFEIATDGRASPPTSRWTTLGEKLALPPFLEPRRAEIEAGLKPIG